MILPIDNTIVHSTLVDSTSTKASLPALLRKKNTTSSIINFQQKIELCDDCGSPLVNGECKDCTKQILL
jgi:predicted amidophosphoribosyltransferase